jgi:phospholipid/cholesterol/gamma-HCH transport system substrate-binding protein
MPNGFFGDVAIGLTPTEPSLEFFTEGDTVPSGPPSVGMLKLAAAADTITQGVNSLLRGVQSEMVDSGGLRDMRRTITAMNGLVAQLGQIAALQSRELQSTMNIVRSRTAAIDSARVDSTVRSLQATAANLSVVTAEMKTTTDRFNSVLGKIDSGDGTIGKLVSDPALANDLRGLIARFDSLTLDIKKNPRKYINLSIF